MKTKDLEQISGLTKHTIHYYEKEGLLHPQRDENGYRNYSDKDVQTLQLIKFLRNLNISIDDVKGILAGKIDFHECLRINQVHVEKEKESLKEIQEAIQDQIDKDIPLIPALTEIKKMENDAKLGFQKTTKTVSLGRRLTPNLARRQLIYTLLVTILFSITFVDGISSMYGFSNTKSLLLMILVFIILEFIFIASCIKYTTIKMLDNSMNQSVEFLSDGIRFYEFKNYLSNFKYFFTVLINKEDKILEYYSYDQIQEIEILPKQRYMKIGSPIAYPIWSVDFAFSFKDGKRFFFYFPMLLNDDSKYIAHIIEEKVANIKDEKNLLYAYKNDININDYLA